MSFTAFLPRSRVGVDSRHGCTTASNHFATPPGPTTGCSESAETRTIIAGSLVLVRTGAVVSVIGHSHGSLDLLIEIVIYASCLSLDLRHCKYHCYIFADTGKTKENKPCQLQPLISQMRCHRRNLDVHCHKEVTGLTDDFLRMQPKTSKCQELEDRLVMPDGLEKPWYRTLDFVEK